MEDAAILGSFDAALKYGLTKEALANLALPVTGAALGALLAPEGETTQGAVLGGLGGLSVNAVGHRLLRRQGQQTANESSPLTVSRGSA